MQSQNPTIYFLQELIALFRLLNALQFPPQMTATALYNNNYHHCKEIKIQFDKLYQFLNKAKLSDDLLEQAIQDNLNEFPLTHVNLLNWLEILLPRIDQEEKIQIEGEADDLSGRLNLIKTIKTLLNNATHTKRITSFQTDLKSFWSSAFRHIDLKKTPDEQDAVVFQSFISEIRGLFNYKIDSDSLKEVLISLKYFSKQNIEKLNWLENFIEFPPYHIKNRYHDLCNAELVDFIQTLTSIPNEKKNEVPLQKKIAQQLKDKKVAEQQPVVPEEDKIYLEQKLQSREQLVDALERIRISFIHRVQNELNGKFIAIKNKYAYLQEIATTPNYLKKILSDDSITLENFSNKLAGIEDLISAQEELPSTTKIYLKPTNLFVYKKLKKIAEEVALWDGILLSSRPSAGNKSSLSEIAAYQQLITDPEKTPKDKVNWLLSHPFTSSVVIPPAKPHTIEGLQKVISNMASTQEQILGYYQDLNYYIKQSFSKINKIKKQTPIHHKFLMIFEKLGYYIDKIFSADKNQKKQIASANSIKPANAGIIEKTEERISPCTATTSQTINTAKKTRETKPPCADNFKIEAEEKLRTKTNKPIHYKYALHYLSVFKDATQTRLTKASPQNLTMESRRKKPEHR